MRLVQIINEACVFTAHDTTIQCLKVELAYKPPATYVDFSTSARENICFLGR